MLFASLAVGDIITCPDSLEVFSHDCKTFFFSKIRRTKYRYFLRALSLVMENWISVTLHFKLQCITTEVQFHKKAKLPGLNGLHELLKLYLLELDCIFQQSVSLNTISVVSVAQASSSPHPHMFLWRIKQQAKPLGTAHKINGIYQCKVLKICIRLKLKCLYESIHFNFCR